MRRRAGHRAREKYQAQRRAWLREHRKAFAVLTLASLGVVVVFHFVMAAWPGDQVWACGFFAGIAFAMLFILRQSPPGMVERWQEGAWGEEMTASELVHLARRGWVVLNDLPNGRYNFDHVILGPAGVFCLNSKKSNCRLEVLPDGKTLRLENRFDSEIAWTDRKMLTQARGEAFALKQVIEQRTGQRLWVQPVLVWWGAFPQEGRPADGVWVVHGSKLVELLERQQARPIPDLVAVVAAIRPGRRRASRRRLARRESPGSSRA